MLNKIMEKWGDRKISLDILVIILLCAGAVLTWSDFRYVSSADAAGITEDRIEEHKILAEAIEAVNNTAKNNIGFFKQYIATHDKAEAKKERTRALSVCRKDIQNTNDLIADLDQFESVSGKNSLSKTRRAELNARLSDLEDTKDCLLDGGDCIDFVN